MTNVTVAAGRVSHALLDTDSLTAIEHAISQGDDPWEMMVSAGIEARERLETGKFEIGDLALLVDKQYGLNRIEDFAKAINLPVDRVKEYRTVCGFWQKSVRTDLLNNCSAITYSHLRQAMRLDDLDVATAFIEKCNANGWTVEKTRLYLGELLGKPTPPAKLVDGLMNVIAVRSDAEGSRFALEPLPGLDPLAIQALLNKTVRVVIYETGNDGNSNNNKTP